MSIAIYKNKTYFISPNLVLTALWLFQKKKRNGYSHPLRLCTQISCTSTEFTISLYTIANINCNCISILYSFSCLIKCVNEIELISSVSLVIRTLVCYKNISQKPFILHSELHFSNYNIFCIIIFLFWCPLCKFNCNLFITDHMPSDSITKHYPCVVVNSKG